MGKGGAVAKNSSSGLASDVSVKEVLIHGRYYDVTSLKHPGGSIIGYYTNNGIDATDAYDNFHVRSERASKYLKALPSRAADPKEESKKMLPGQEQLLKDFQQFEADLIKEGFFEPSMPHTIYRLSELIVLHVVGLYLALNGYFYSGVALLGIGCGRCGWLMHEGGHYSMTGNIAIDKMFQVWIYGVGCGMSGSWWRNQHNKHHSMPQKLGHDVDLNTLPLVAFTNKVVKRSGFPQKLWLKMQAFLFPVITCLLVALGWQFFLHPRHILRTKNYMELAALLVRGALWTYFFVPAFGTFGAFKTYLLYTLIAADYIFINFAVSHTHLPTVGKEDRQTDWVRYASIHTMNVLPGPFKFVTWWMSFLNYQIEHHLFPCMPQFRHPLISGRVKKFFEDHGLVYHQMSYTDAVAVTFKNLHKVGDEAFLG
jgi:fatty acid desaturase